MAVVIMAATPTEQAAKALRRAILAGGGLITCSGISRRWHISKTRAQQLAAMPDFPAPVAKLGQSAVYIVNEVDEWRDARI